MAKEGSTIGGLMDSFGTAISISLQYGVPLEVLVNKFSHTRFEPMGHTTNPDIRIAKSVVDYIFRWLGITFLAGYREASMGQFKAAAPTPVVPAPVAEKKPTADAAKSPVNGNTAEVVSVEYQTTARFNSDRVDSSTLERAGVVMMDGTSSSHGNRSEQFARFQSDAPSCDNCGSITVRNGNCYLCHNCGNSMGCS